MTGSPRVPRMALAVTAVLAVAPIAAAQAPVPAETIACAPRLPGTEDAGAPRLVGHPGGELRRVFQEGDAVLLAVGSADGVSVGTQFFLRRTAVPAEHVLRGTGLRALVTSGWVRTVEVDEHASLGVVEHACREVRPEDRLHPFQWPAAVSPAASGTPDYEGFATVLLGEEGRSLLSAGQFAVIDRGEELGLRPGQAVTFYQPALADQPATITHLGWGVVVLVDPLSATVLLQATRAPVRTGDRAAPHR